MYSDMLGYVHMLEGTDTSNGSQADLPGHQPSPDGLEDVGPYHWQHALQFSYLRGGADV